ncbi:MAG: hypothetical protein KDA54_09090 [Phycisphaerales bacterium]|nr:hypothetical protein [Phycisphaerales bacterium]
MAIKLGMNGKMYYLGTGTRASWGTADSDGIHGGAAPASLVELGNVRDVTLNLEEGEADVTTRANNGWRATEPTLKEGSVEFEMAYDPADTGFAKILGGWLNRIVIPMAILDGDESEVGTMGLWADFKVISFSKGEPLEEGQMVSVTVKPAYSTVAPEWVKVTS